MSCVWRTNWLTRKETPTLDPSRRARLSRLVPSGRSIGLSVWNAIAVTETEKKPKPAPWNPTIRAMRGASTSRVNCDMPQVDVAIRKMPTKTSGRGRMRMSSGPAMTEAIMVPMPRGIISTPEVEIG